MLFLNYFIFISTFFVISSSYGLEIKPDEVKSHCLAFLGNWEDGTCFHRMEYQQTPINTGRKVKPIHQQQWCQSRGGFLKETSRGARCEATKSSQGIQRYNLSNRSSRDAITEDVFHSCIENDKVLNAKCEVFDTNEENTWFNYTKNENLVHTSIMNIMLGVIRRFGYNHSGEKARSFLISSLKGYLTTHKLNSCQKACLVKCASANILRFKSNSDTKFQSISEAYSQRVGECTEFSSVANDLAGALNIPSTIVAGRSERSGHAWNFFRINNGWYMGEPQNDKCEFFHTENTKNKYEILFPEISTQTSKSEIIELPKSSRK